MARTFLLTVIVLLGLCSFAACANTKLTQSQELQLFYNIFKDWISKYNKQYGIEELAIRFLNWKNNFDFVQDFNSKNTDTILEMNHFGDLNSEEFSALHLGLNADLEAKRRHSNRNRNNNNNKKADVAPKAKNYTNANNGTNGTNATNGTQNATNATKPKPNYKNLPKSVDWRKSGAVTEVKNQGSCGACWSFSAAGALEGLHAIKKNRLVDLSVQQMVDCAGEDWGNKGCDGGLMMNAFNYTSVHGIQGSDGYDYQQAVGECQYAKEQVVFKNTGFEEVEMNNSLALKAAVSKQPVSVGIEAHSMVVQLFRGGIIAGGCGVGLDHGVLVVGYDVSPKGNEYWIVKNSWGPQWGLNGYFHVLIGQQNEGMGVCGINILASYPTLELNK